MDDPVKIKNGISSKRSIEDIINDIGDRPTILMLLLFTVAMSLSAAGTYDAYMVAFTGIIPEYECRSDNCTAARANYSTNPDKSDRDAVCDFNLEKDTDYVFDTSRTTLVIDYDLYCEKSKLALLSSYYFLGGTIGLFIGLYIFDVIGRRTSCIAGSLLNLIVTFFGLFCDSYPFMVAIRIFQGVGQFSSYASCYIWVLEFVPAKYRNYYNSWSMLIWAMGYPGLVLISYFITNWHYIHVAACGVFILNYVPLFLLPNSPRYLLSVGKADEAKSVLQKYAKVAGKKLDLTDVTLTVNDGDESEKATYLSFTEKVASFWREKALLIEMLVLFYGWFVVCLLFYGLNYGWGSFGDTPYVNYLYVAAGETLAYLFLIAVTKYMGRRFGMIFCFGGACICFFVGMISWQWTDVWNLERFVSIVAIVLISCAFGLIFLYTGELAPTTHRGTVLSASSLCARAAGFLGPFVTDVSEDSRIRLAICALLSGTAAMLFFLLPETRGRAIPETAEDVTARRKEQDLNNVSSIMKLKVG